MEQQKTHWKKLQNPDYIGAYSLPVIDGKPQDLIVKIVSVSRGVVKGADGKKDECTIAVLENQKPFIINATNAKTITKLYDSPFIEDWAGKFITLFHSKVKVASDWIECLRIRPTIPVIAPVTLPPLLPNHPQWAVIKADIHSGKTTIADLTKQYFTISPEIEQQLLTP